ncbi:MAG: hypothetical protein KatS3mg104_3234 [Phycisphaerae bacterium]|nr:MAG: hypothetical protein KatS3mg104_3234 [Phycisphaerae bacterium]
MNRFIRRKTGQSTLEYAILIVIVIGALISIQMYIKRGIQGRLRSATDDIGDQYDPGNTEVNIKTVTESTTQETFVEGIQSRNLISAEQVNVESNEALINAQQTFWGANVTK